MNKIKRKEKDHVLLNQGSACGSHRKEQNMTASIKNVAAKLKEIIDHNGPEYLREEPYNTYVKMMESGETDRKTAGAILFCLVSGVMESLSEDIDFGTLSKDIQRQCSFNKKMADRLAAIFLALYSKDNKEEWESKAQGGLAAFLDDEFEEYCTEDDYYQPVVEDFQIDYYVAEWCKIKGFEMVSCDGEGDDGGYEPKFLRKWY